MLKNYIKIALRKIVRQKLYSFINIGGLAVGIAASVLIFSFILNEWSYDRFHQNHERIFRIVTGNIGEPDAWAGTPAQLGPALKDNYPEIKEFIRLDINHAFVRTADKSFHERKVLYADSSLFSFFSFPIISGNTNEILSAPNDIVISASTAKKYFDKQDPLGQTMILNDKDEYRVTGVFADVPKNSHLQFDMVVPFEKINTQGWGAFNFSTYILIAPDINKQALLDKIRQFVVKNNDQSKRTFEFLNLQPLTEIHFQYIRGNYEPVYDLKFIYILGSVAVFILLLAGINYINMTTALAPTRAKEVGIKKVVGSSRSRLLAQFMSESFVHVTIAVICAILLIEFTAPQIGSMLEKEVTTDFLSMPVLAALIAITLLVGLLSGGYPAFLMSLYKPTVILKGSLLGKRKSVLRNVLVVLQFSISIFLIIGTLTSLQQLNFLKNKDLGMDKELIVNVPLNSLELLGKGQELKNEFLKHPNILKASVNSFQPGSDNWHQSVYWEGQSKDISMYIFSVDKDFFTTFGITIDEGKEMIQNYVPGNPYGFVLNESGFKETGWKHAAGKRFSAFSNPPKEIALGVVKDFNFRTLHHQVEPCAIVITDKGELISVKITNQDIPATLEYLKTTIKSFAPHISFEYYFVDDAYYQLYDFERSSSKAILFFTILSILIASLGLFGLASFIMIQKTKEIGIRKVLGASISQIMGLLSKEFLLLVAVANLVAWPIAYFAMNKWLQNFAYRIDITWWMFALAGGIALIIALTTISLQTIKSATANPVESLKYE